MTLYAIWDNLFSYLVKVNQNLKFLHWASILIGNLPVSALYIVIAVFISSQQPLQDLFWTNSAGSFFNYPLQSIPHTSLA